MNNIRRLSDRRMYVFMAIIALESLAANFAHPITPTLIKNLGLPDYMFGVAFAGMAFTNFLFSPLWAELVSKLSSRKVLLICCCGYGIGQLLFMSSTTQLTILFARLFSGLFVGGIFVSYLTYIINMSEENSRGKFLALNATFQTVFGAFGYLVGGFLGLVSIPITFAAQAATLIGSGILFFIFSEDDREEKSDQKFDLVKSSNPFKAFLDARKFMTVTFVWIFVVVFISSTASTAYDQNFNYYIKDVLNLTSNYNGILKALVGFISLLVNTTICMWLMRNTNVKRVLVVIFGIGSILLILMFTANSLIPFMIINIVFFAVNAIYIPLVQDVCANNAKRNESNMVMGFYNAMKSFGMIIGALIAGFVYSYGASVAFIVAALGFFVSAVIMYSLSSAKH